MEKISVIVIEEQKMGINLKEYKKLIRFGHVYGKRYLGIE